MKTANTTDEYTWGDQMTPELRARLEADIRENNEQEPPVNRRDLSGLQEESNSQVFLLWLRS